jgi:import inner membrane translocase subunit TIM22
LNNDWVGEKKVSLFEHQNMSAPNDEMDQQPSPVDPNTASQGLMPTSQSKVVGLDASSFQRMLPKEQFRGVPQSDLNFTEWCTFRALQAGVAGGGLGLLFGAFMASAGSDPTLTGQPVETEWATKAAFRRMMKDTWTTMKSHSKTFAVCGLAYSACECIVEKELAVKNIYTAMGAGCLAGAALGVRGGVQAMAFGCAGFAGFSALIEYVMDH